MPTLTIDLREFVDTPTNLVVGAVLTRLKEHGFPLDDQWVTTEKGVFSWKHPSPDDRAIITYTWVPAERRLKPEYQELVDEFKSIYHDSGCTCFISPPCSYCTHPGNPACIENMPEAYEDDED